MFQPNDKVRCIDAVGASLLNEGEVYTVVVVVNSGMDHLGECAGVILDHVKYPYVWDANRFVLHI